MNFCLVKVNLAFLINIPHIKFTRNLSENIGLSGNLKKDLESIQTICSLRRLVLNVLFSVKKLNMIIFIIVDFKKSILTILESFRW